MSKPKRTRNRKGASCKPCQDKKRRCDRMQPCSSCAAHSQDCIWDSNSLPPLVTARERQENEFLRNEVNRLQEIIDKSCPSSSRASSSDQNEVSSPFESMGRGDSISSEDKDELLDEDLASADLVQALGQLTLSQFINTQRRTTDITGSTLVQEARTILEEKSPPFITSSDDLKFIPPSTPALRSPIGSLFSSQINGSRHGISGTSKTFNLAEIMKKLPTREAAQKNIGHYWRSIDWYIHPIPTNILNQHLDHVFTSQAQGLDADPFSLANVYACSAVGLAQTALKPGREAEGILAKSWLDLAGDSLVLGGYLEYPSLEAIRALLIIATHYFALSPGDDGGIGLALLALTVQSALQLQLHRDPTKLTNQKFSSAEAEDRRRIFWLVFLSDQQASSVTGRAYTLLHMSDIDTALPQDVPDKFLGLREDQISQTGETEMTSLITRIRLSQVGERIYSEAFGINPISYSQIKALDAEVNAIASSIPPIYDYETVRLKESIEPMRAIKTYIIELALSQERLKLHRPYLMRSYSDDTYQYSQQICISDARRVLEIQASPLCRSPWSGLCFKSICAAIILAIDLIQRPFSEQANSYRILIQSALARIDGHSKVSILCRRGAKVLKFLQAKDSIRMSAGPVIKRSRLSVSGDVGPQQVVGSTSDRRRKAPSMPNLVTQQDFNTNVQRDYSSLPNPQHFDFNSLAGLNDQPHPFQYIDSIPIESPSSFLSSIPSPTSHQRHTSDQSVSYFSSRDPILSLLETDSKSDGLYSHSKSSSLGPSETSSSSYGTEYDTDLETLYDGLFGSPDDLGKNE